MDVIPGLRVVRGPDWSCVDQDGGEGHVGTVVEVDSEGRSVMVQWDCGGRHRYRCGAEGKYDLRVFDSAPAGMKYPHNTCLKCKVQGIAGMLWKCSKCCDYFLCSPCYMSGRHSLQHEFMRIEQEEQTKRTRVPSRGRTNRMEAKGIFPGAQVVRGHDWRWGDQDGGLGMIGKVVSILGWKRETSRSIVQIEWMGSHNKNVYRVGHNGKVDLKCTVSGSGCGGYYYPDHLPVLGAPYVPPMERDFAAGDKIKIELDPDVWKLMQEGHGGWNDLMTMFIGMTGKIQHIDDSGDLMVNFMSNAMFHVNREVVTKVEGDVFKAGDIIRIVDDMGEVVKLQKDHGEWNDDMALALGQVGRIVKKLPQGDIQVSVHGRRWVFNPLCLKPAPGETPPTATEESHISPLAHAQILSLLEKMNPEVVPVAAGAGDDNTLREYLLKCPNEVNTKFQGKAALHLAAGEGYTHILKTLLEFRPNLDIEDETSERPLHYAVTLNQEEAAQLLVDAGADVNSKNAVGIFPLLLATVNGSCGILRLIANAARVELNAQDIESNSALHMAVLGHKSEAVSILLDAGADPTTLNSGYFTPILEAAKNGFYAGIEQFMESFPEHVSMLKVDDGHTALHIAAANDHLDIVCLLAVMNTCDLDARNAHVGLTPMHIATQRGYSRILEYLVGYGADVNVADNNGNTTLHVVTNNKDMMPPSPDGQTPELEKVHSQLAVLNGGTPVQPYVTVACFLVREGADIHIQNLVGVSPLQVCPSDMAALITRFDNEFGGKVFHGSLKRSPPSTTRVRQRFPQAVRKVEDQSHLVKVQQPLAQKPPQRDIHTTQPQSGILQQQLPQEMRGEEHTTQLPPSEQRSQSAPGGAASAPPTPLDIQLQDMDINKEITKSFGRERTSFTMPGSESVPSGHHNDDDDDELCILCESPANVEFQPCGHIAMCSQCADRAKRCPTCQKPVTSKSRIDD